MPPSSPAPPPGGCLSLTCQLQLKGTKLSPWWAAGDDLPHMRHHGVSLVTLNTLIVIAAVQVVVFCVGGVGVGGAGVGGRHKLAEGE